MPAGEIKKQIGDDIWNDYFKFCVVRNPYEKLVSAYHFNQWLIDNSSGLSKVKKMLSHGLFPGRSRDTIKRFRKWVAWTWWFNDRDKYLIDGEICVDYFIRYETLLPDIESVCQRLDVPYQPERLPKLKSEINPRDIPLNEYYDRKTRDLVQKRWSFEIEKFGYSLPE